MRTGIILLAGGRSLRLGRNKLGEVLEGESLLHRSLRLVLPLGQVWVVGDGRPLELPPEVRLVADLLPGRGPMGGVFTGLLASPSYYSLVVACDMPFLKPELLRYLLRAASGYDLALPRVQDKVEPLHAVYSRPCLAPLRHLLGEGHTSLLELLPRVKVRYVEERELRSADPHLLSLFNVNTQEDLERARSLLAGAKEARQPPQLEGRGTP